MKEYKVEMLQNGKWEKASIPFEGFPRTFETKEAAEKYIIIAKDKWKYANELNKNNIIPKNYRILSREVSDWTTEKQ